MGYSIKREHVLHNLDMLKAINDKIQQNESFVLKPRGDLTSSAVAFKIRNMLKSAETYDEYGFSHLAAQVSISTKPKEVEISPRYGYAEQKILTDLGAIEQLNAESGDYATITFRLVGDLEDFESAIEEEWNIIGVKEHKGTETVTISFARKASTPSESPFSLLSDTESTDYDEYLRKLMDEAEGG